MGKGDEVEIKVLSEDKKAEEPDGKAMKPEYVAKEEEEEEDLVSTIETKAITDIIASATV